MQLIMYCNSCRVRAAFARAAKILCKLKLRNLLYLELQKVRRRMLLPLQIGSREERNLALGNSDKGYELFRLICYCIKIGHVLIGWLAKEFKTLFWSMEVISGVSFYFPFRDIDAKRGIIPSRWRRTFVQWSNLTEEFAPLVITLAKSLPRSTG